MAAELPSDIPTTLTAGDSWAWRWAFDGYSPADGWALAVVIRLGAGVVEMTTAADADAPDAFRVSAGAGDTLELPGGVYNVAARATKGAGAVTVRTTTVRIVADLATAADADVVAPTTATTRSTAEMLADVRARIRVVEASPRSYQFRDRGLVNPELDPLYRREKDLTERLKEETRATARAARGGGMRVRLGVPL